MTDKITPVTLTEQAAEAVRIIMQNKKIPEGYALRIGIKGSGGCGGFDYLLGFDQKREDDLVYDSMGIPILVEKKHTMYLLGLQVDFTESENGRGFTFINLDELDHG